MFLEKLGRGRAFVVVVTLWSAIVVSKLKTPYANTKLKEVIYEFKNFCSRLSDCAKELHWQEHDQTILSGPRALADLWLKMLTLIILLDRLTLQKLDAFTRSWMRWGHNLSAMPCQIRM